MMTSLTPCTFISLICTRPLACCHPYVLLLLSFLRFSPQKQKNKISTGTFILAQRQNGHVATTSRWFYCCDWSLYTFGQQLSALKLYKRCTTWNMKMAGTLCLCHSGSLAQSTLKLQLLTFTDHNPPIISPPRDRLWSGRTLPGGHATVCVAPIPRLSHSI